MLISWELSWICSFLKGSRRNIQTTSVVQRIFPLSLFLSSPFSSWMMLTASAQMANAFCQAEFSPVFPQSCASLLLFSLSCVFFCLSSYSRPRWTYFFVSEILCCKSVCVELYCLNSSKQNRSVWSCRAKYTSLYQWSGNMNYTPVLIAGVMCVLVIWPSWCMMILVMPLSSTLYVVLIYELMFHGSLWNKYAMKWFFPHSLWYPGVYIGEDK